MQCSGNVNHTSIYNRVQMAICLIVITETEIFQSRKQYTLIKKNQYEFVTISYPQ